VLTTASASGVALVAFPHVEAVLLANGGWIHGAVAGLLLHAVLHAVLPVRHTLRAPNARGYEVVGFLAGALLVLAAIVAHGSLSEIGTSKSITVVIGGFLLAVVGHLAWPHPPHHDDELEVTKV